MVMTFSPQPRIAVDDGFRTGLGMLVFGGFGFWCLCWLLPLTSGCQVGAAMLVLFAHEETDEMIRQVMRCQAQLDYACGMFRNQLGRRCAACQGKRVKGRLNYKSWLGVYRADLHRTVPVLQLTCLIRFIAVVRELGWSSGWNSRVVSVNKFELADLKGVIDFENDLLYMAPSSTDS